MRSTLLGLCLFLSVGTAQATDIVTIDVELFAPTFGSYRLTGQSAFIQTRTGSGTSGGQLDGVTSGSTTMSFQEVFPPPSKADYIGFAYFGILETLDLVGNIIDTSLVMAFDAGDGVGTLVDDTFPYTEAQLVSAMTGGLDSPEFLDMLDLVPANASTLGDIAVPVLGRPGTTMDLVGFIAGSSGLNVGTLKVTVVPEPSSFALLALAGLSLWIYRQRNRG